MFLENFGNFGVYAVGDDLGRAWVPDWEGGRQRCSWARQEPNEQSLDSLQTMEIGSMSITSKMNSSLKA